MLLYLQRGPTPEYIASYPIRYGLASKLHAMRTVRQCEVIGVFHIAATRWIRGAPVLEMVSRIEDAFMGTAHPGRREGRILEEICLLCQVAAPVVA